MCERKPGPRCSADTLKHLQAQNKRAGELLAKYESSLNEFNAMRSAALASKDAYASEWFEADLLGSSLEDINRQLRIQEDKVFRSNLSFNATPEGLNSLKRLGDTLGSTVTVKKFTIWNDEVEYNEPNAEVDVEIAISRKAQLRNTLEAAQQQREWQSQALKILSDAEKESPEKALVYAQGIQTQEQTALTNAGKLYGATSNEKAVTLKKLGYDPENVELKQQLGSQILLQESLKEQVEYLKVRVNDLESYVQTARNKVKVPVVI